MAEASRYQEPAVTTLTLSDEEAIALVDVFSLIGGHPDKSRRGVIDAVHKALRESGHKWNAERARDITGPGLGRGLQFLDLDQFGSSAYDD